MTERAKTKDELFMLSLYEEALRRSEMEAPIDRYEIGKRVGLHPRAVEAICRLLIRANFIRPQGQADISITPHGVQLAQNLLSQDLYSSGRMKSASETARKLPRLNDRK